MNRHAVPLALFALALGFAACGEKEPLVRPGPGPEVRPASARVLEAYDRGLDYLKVAAEGGRLGDPGLAGLAAGAFLHRPGGLRPQDKPFVDGLLADLLKFQKDNGGIYDQGLANYTTCVAIMALKAAGGPAHEAAVAKAVAFLRTLQTAEGGIGYSDKTPGWADLSNTQFALESLRVAGVQASDPIYSKALQFLQRVQNRSESNNVSYRLEDGRIVASTDDGGAFYSPTESKAEMVELSDGRFAFRSYGSMTYALLKCYLLAGLPKDDPRVKDTAKWIGNNFTLEENPGFDTAKDPDAGQQGLFYYYLTLAKALDLYGEEKVRDADGIEHAWRAELRETLLGRQGKDGSWKNERDRWMEGEPAVATSFALVALSYCR